MSETASPHARVILSATCYADAEAALHLAVLLARTAGAGLHGILVSDETILSAAAHPHARAVSFSGQAVTQVTVETMHAAFRADARLFQKRLTEAAQKAVLETSFSAIRGRMMAVLARSAEARDIIVIGFRRSIKDGDALVLVLGDRDAGHDQLAFALQLSALTRKRLIVFATPRREGEVVAILARQRGNLHEYRPYLGTANLLRELERMSPAAVIIATGQEEVPPVGALINAARCPVVLTGPAADGV
ncbi:hypothetical protein QKW60_16875 [Defluviimonas aestuarii]|uniref:hypothetical protein n=1 Tax=Albidovulum aestuarii TaxID=1130726 RepID=UPI00249B562E|nr:hypothetical protein [Defluviimonas aestuarii]MDI3338084.1 hypothetical protein [Defluviimonas aestuarii]